MNKRELELQESHRAYGDFNQSERSDNRYMAANGHPFAGDYRRLRAEFDKLRYACNSNARFVAYKNRDECAEYWAPKIDVSWDPKGLKGFYHVYPAMGDQWEKYLDAAAVAGWPEGVEPTLDAGNILVKSRNPRLIGELYGACDGAGRIERDDSGIHFTAYLKETKHVLACLRVIRKRMKKWLLPLRKAADNANDTQEIPLGEKSFRLANVKHVTVDARSVLVPLVPVGDATAVLRIGNALLSLCRQGFPYDKVRAWLVGSDDSDPRFIDRRMLGRLDKEFGHSTKMAMKA